VVPSVARALYPSVVTAAPTRYITAEHLKMSGGGAEEVDLRRGDEVERGRR
jgi:hypothetical protein